MADQKISSRNGVKSNPKGSNLIDLIVDSIQDIKGKKIVKLDLSKIEDASADGYIICEGESTVQAKAIAANIQRRTREELGLKAGHVEGENNARWILIDYFEVLVHIFHYETRAFYDIEELWSDADMMHYDDM